MLGLVGKIGAWPPINRLLNCSRLGPESSPSFHPVLSILYRKIRTLPPTRVFSRDRNGPSKVARVGYKLITVEGAVDSEHRGIAPKLVAVNGEGKSNANAKEVFFDASFNIFFTQVGEQKWHSQCNGPRGKHHSSW